MADHSKDEGPLTYASYLRVQDLTSLQQPRSRPPEHDETLFLVIHQTYELWFKQILYELDALVEDLSEARDHRALHTFHRIRTIMKTLVGQVDILETMTPVSFASFRSRLESASGFQSLQFRQVEMVLGKRDPRVMAFWKHDPASHAMLADLAGRPTLYDAFLKYLDSHGFCLPQELLARDPRNPIDSSESVRQAVIEAYRQQGLVAAVCERMVDLDEGLQEWRYRHVKMVERTIGAKSGTGGSSGVAYLRSTLFQPLFEDLWAVRESL